MPRTALIVDDAFSLRQLVAFTMRDAGFEVLEGGNGQQGLDQLAGHKVDIIITDLNMPVMDGITFIKNLRQMPTSKYTPVLMLTTESQASLKQEAKAAGATGWIVKPFQPAKLLEVIRKVLP
jgi:two-component system chemotaxis response regulator CheY